MGAWSTSPNCDFSWVNYSLTRRAAPHLFTPILVLRPLTAIGRIKEGTVKCVSVWMLADDKCSFSITSYCLLPDANILIVVILRTVLFIFLFLFEIM